MEPFKNLLNTEAAEKIANAIQRVYPAFSKQEFLKNIDQELKPLELKQRVKFLKSRLDATLPLNPEKSFPILIQSLKSKKNPQGLSEFVVWPLAQFVMENGLNHHSLSMNALYEITKVFTAEFAIRPFLIHNEAQTIATLKKWARDESEHVRRLVSEGSRPLLPWGEKIHTFVKDPKKTWHLLQVLKHDTSVYVQKSVANHLNDHSKNHAPWLVKELKQWKKESTPQNKIDWIIRHGTRTLVKKGMPQALELHGVKPIRLSGIKTKILTPKVTLGNFFEVSVTLQNPTTKLLPLIIDHELLLLKSNGKHQGKVFKGCKVTLKPKEKQTLNLRLKIKAVTTRKYYSGEQGWLLMINGQKTKPMYFDLKI